MDLPLRGRQARGEDVITDERPFHRSQVWQTNLERQSLLSEAIDRLNHPNPLDEDGTARSLSQQVANARLPQGSVEIPPSSEGTGASKTQIDSNANSQGGQAESADDMMLRLSNEFQPIVDDDWDTVIYIGPPPQEHGQDDHEYQYIVQHFANPYLMNSRTLRDTASAQFSKFLGPMSVRAERRLKKLGIHRLIPQDRKPKYYIDLRPMQDEDEALLMITELTCTRGILSWHLSHLASGVPRTLICGRDELNITRRPHAGRSWMEVEDSGTNDLDDVEKSDSDDGQRDLSIDGILDVESDYSALRHYTAVERLLHAIAGHDPKLNSAAKVWTYFSIAKFFDCATNTKVNSWIYEWLFSSNNSNFVQANPEVAYRMALGMKSPHILRTAFAMLVGERALAHAGRTTSDSMMMNPGAHQVSVHGRTTCHLDDDEVNRIDHAAFSLTRRITRIFDRLANDPLSWSLSSRSELAKFELVRETFPDEGVVKPPHTLLHDYIRGEVFQTLSQNVQEGDLMRLYRTMGSKQCGWLKRSQSFADAYNAMPLPQRLLTQSFWSQLENSGFYQELEKVVAWTRGHSLNGLRELAQDFDFEIACVQKRELCFAIDDMNECTRLNRSWVQTQSANWVSAHRQHTRAPESRQLIRWGDEFHVAPDADITRAVSAIAGLYPVIPRARDGASNSPSFQRHKGQVLEVRPVMLLAELTADMRRIIMDEVLTPGHVNDEMAIESDISISQMDILLCLNDDEWKYLPLWAGGLDDGSGGVFAELDVPDMEAIEGFRGGRMGLGTVSAGGNSVGGSFSVIGDSEHDFDEVMTDEGISTVGRASRIATDGTTSAGGSTVMSLDE